MSLNYLLPVCSTNSPPKTYEKQKKQLVAGSYFLFLNSETLLPQLHTLYLLYILGLYSFVIILIAIKKII